jgi:hypothetical protein
MSLKDESFTSEAISNLMVGIPTIQLFPKRVHYPCYGAPRKPLIPLLGGAASI